MHIQTGTDRWTDHGEAQEALPGVPMPSHTYTHTYSSSPFTTSIQRDSVREVAEADLGQNGETY